MVQARWRRWLGSATLLTALLLAGCRAQPGTAPVEPWPTLPAAPSPTVAAATPTRDPLVPTPLPAGVAAVVTATQPITSQDVLSGSTAAPLPEIGGPSGETQSPAAAVPPLEPGSLRSRLGLSVPIGVSDIVLTPELAQRLGMGWYLDWHTNLAPLAVDGLEFAQLYAMRGANIPLQRQHIADVLAANPGALWLAGNEPDVIWQDNQTPEEYARLYHEFYTFVKTLDPSAQVAIGGISQVTPLRLQYLERVLASYQERYGQPMPVDIWNIHAFVLREERDSWGVSIPPGFDVDQGLLWEIEDHGDLDLFKQQIVDFRRWMVKQGQRDKPLLVTEFGILMPESYGFPPDMVQQYMIDTFDYMLNARDAEIGFLADDNRLVQRFSWFSLADPTYPAGNLVDLETGELTPLGEAFAAYAAGLVSAQPAEQ